MPYYETRDEERQRKAHEFFDSLSAIKEEVGRAAVLPEVGNVIRSAIIEGGLDSGVEGGRRPTLAEAKKCLWHLERALALFDPTYAWIMEKRKVDPNYAKDPGYAKGKEGK